MLGTRQTLGTRRTKLLPCVAKKTHGKLQPHGKILNHVTLVSYLLCAYGLNPRQTLNTRQTFQTHNGKKLQCAAPWHSANNHICRVFYMFAVCLGPSTRQSIDKKVKLTLPNFFQEYTYCVWTIMLTSGIFLILFAIFNYLNSLITFLRFKSYLYC